MSAPDDWFEIGMERLYADVAAETGLPQDTVEKVYAAFDGYYLVDYDIEKEVIWDLYFADDDEEDGEE